MKNKQMQSLNASIGEISVKGRQIEIPSIEAEGVTIAITGRLLRIGVVRDEPWIATPVTNPAKIISLLKESRPRPDIFTFAQRLPDTKPKYDFHIDYDNVAAVEISTYDHWLKHQIKADARNKVRKSEKNGVVTRVVCFDDEFVEGITRIYNEVPVRQGKQFWHFGKNAETVKRENSTYLDQSEFIGAFRNDQLIGFLKMVYVGTYAEVMQILSLVSERDSAPTNALIAKAIEVCAQKNLSHFVYANFTYGAKGEDSLTEFKRRNGFIKIDLPRYYAGLTIKGKVAIALGIHKGVKEMLPRRLILMLIGARAIVQNYGRRLASLRTKVR